MNESEEREKIRSNSNTKVQSQSVIYSPTNKTKRQSFFFSFFVFSSLVFLSTITQQTGTETVKQIQKRRVKESGRRKTGNTLARSGAGERNRTTDRSRLARLKPVDSSVNPPPGRPPVRSLAPAGAAAAAVAQLPLLLNAKMLRSLQHTHTRLLLPPSDAATAATTAI